MLLALTGRGYKKLAIQEGGVASLEFLRMTHGEVVDDERQGVRQQLEHYCGLNTDGMIWILESLRQLAA